jgi:hypothetical protein
VVFLPKNTLHFGKCGSDKCYCVEVGISLLLLYHHLLRPRPLDHLLHPRTSVPPPPPPPSRCTVRRRNGAASGFSSGASTSRMQSH